MKHIYEAAMHQAAAEGLPELLAETLQHAHPDALGGSYVTALMRAVDRRRTECARMMLEHGANPDIGYQGPYWLWVSACSTGRGTPMHTAVLNSDPAMLRLLVQYGADPDIRDAKDETPLHLTAHVEDESLFKQLLDAIVRANPNPFAESEMGRTPRNEVDNNDFDRAEAFKRLEETYEAAKAGGEEAPVGSTAL